MEQPDGSAITYALAIDLKVIEVAIKDDQPSTNQRRQDMEHISDEVIRNVVEDFCNGHKKLSRRLAVRISHRNFYSRPARQKLWSHMEMQNIAESGSELLANVANDQGFPRPVWTYECDPSARWPGNSTESMKRTLRARCDLLRE